MPQLVDDERRRVEHVLEVRELLLPVGAGTPLGHVGLRCASRAPGRARTGSCGTPAFRAASRVRATVHAARPIGASARRSSSPDGTSGLALRPRCAPLSGCARALGAPPALVQLLQLLGRDVEPLSHHHGDPCAARIRPLRRSRAATAAVEREWHAGPRGDRTRQPLECIDQDRRGRHVGTVRTNERADEARARLTADIGRRAASRRPARVLGQTRRHTQESAVLGEQVAEVQRAALRVLELVGQHRMNRASDDRRFDHRGRVHADHRVAVEERVEVVLAIGFVDRVGRPRVDRDVASAGSRRRASAPSCTGAAGPGCRPPRAPGTPQRSIHRRTKRSSASGAEIDAVDPTNSTNGRSDRGRLCGRTRRGWSAVARTSDRTAARR